jgi:hypothetical protein
MEEDDGPPPLSDLAEAVLEWSDPERVAELRALRAAAFAPGCENPSDAWINKRTADHPFFKYRKIEEELEKRFLERVMQGELILSAFTAPITPGSRREVLFPELLEVVELDFFHGEGYGEGFKLVKFQVHGADPSLELKLARAKAVSDNEFTHNGDYSRVSIRGLVFELAGGLRQIVRYLHEASQTHDPWVHGKRLLGDCGYGSTWMGDVFKRYTDPSWRELIEGNRRGSYRLNLRR